MQIPYFLLLDTQIPAGRLAWGGGVQSAAEINREWAQLTFPAMSAAAVSDNPMVVSTVGYQVGKRFFKPFNEIYLNDIFHTKTL